jgi:phosphopentomutase
MGINNITKINKMEHKTKNQSAYTARVEGISNAKDTLSGH